MTAEAATDPEERERNFVMEDRGKALELFPPRPGDGAEVPVGRQLPGQAVEQLHRSAPRFGQPELGMGVEQVALVGGKARGAGEIE